MQTAWKITEADRDERGFVKVNDEPRSLADLLPKPEEIRQDAKRQPWTRKELGALAVVALCAAFVVIYAWATPGTATAPPLRQTTAPTLQPTSAPTAAPATPVRLLAAFAAPDGITLGTIEATRPMTPTAHYGDGWIQAQVQGSGLIWLRAADLPGVALTGPDLAPRWPVPAPAVQPATAAPAPTRCAEVGIPGKMAQACGMGDLVSLQQQAQAQWTAQYGAQFAREAQR
jgi:hypothetical protein